MATVAERFWAKVDKSGECWLWTGARTTQGYGHIRIAGRSVKAHRVSWQIANGAIPDGIMVCHHCDNPRCVNPAHLFLGTGSDNMRDMGAKGRHPGHGKVGSDCAWVARLTADDVAHIRLAAETLPVTQAALAQVFGVSKSNIRRILLRETWVHVG